MVAEVRRDIRSASTRSCAWGGHMGAHGGTWGQKRHMGAEGLQEANGSRGQTGHQVHLHPHLHVCAGGGHMGQWRHMAFECLHPREDDRGGGRHAVAWYVARATDISLTYIMGSLGTYEEEWGNVGTLLDGDTPGWAHLPGWMKLACSRSS